MLKVRKTLITVRTTGLVLFAILILVGAAGVRSVPTAIASESSQAVMEVDIALSEWSLAPPVFNFQVGDRVVFNISNAGRFPHALEVSNSASHLHAPTIAAGETTTLEVTFEYSGEYTILCPIPGHAGLGMMGILTVDGGEPAPDTGEFLGTTLMRLSPRNGSNVDSTSLEVRAILHDFELAPDDIGQDYSTDGQGHWDLSLDDELVSSVGSTSFMLEDLTPGEHVIRAELKHSDGSPLDPPVEVSSTIQVAQQVDIALSEWSLAPPVFNFQAGDRIVFNISNTGRFPHALEVSNSVSHLHAPTISAGETTTLAVTLANGGEYTFICPIPGHAALGMVAILTVDGGDPAPDTGEFLGTPLMRLSPRSGTEVEGNSQEVRVTLHDFELAPDDIGNADNVAGQGHWALFLDDELVESVGAGSFILEDLSPGEHTVKVELRNNDGTSLDPVLEVSSTITVPQPAADDEPEAPSVGDPSIPLAARSALPLGLALVLIGGVFVFRSRRRTA